MTKEKIDKIRKHFENIRECHVWEINNGDTQPEKLNNMILPAVEKEYDALESLGVDRSFAAMVFVFGGMFTGDLGKL